MSARTRTESDTVAGALLESLGSAAWAERVAARAGDASTGALADAADAEWSALDALHMKDVLEAHAVVVPRVGDTATQQAAELALQLYRARFGHAFVSAVPSRAADEFLMRVRIRLGNEPEVEWRISCEEVRRSARQRLEARLAGPHATGTVGHRP